jgi:hypothetical protein
MIDFANAGSILKTALLAGTVFVAMSRFRGKLDSNVPLFYYLALVAYGSANPNRINPYVLYVSVVAGLLLRFEFMNEKVMWVVRIFEVTCLAYVGMRLAQLILTGY